MRTLFFYISILLLFISVYFQGEIFFNNTDYSALGWGLSFFTVACMAFNWEIK